MPLPRLLRSLVFMGGWLSSLGIGVAEVLPRNARTALDALEAAIQSIASFDVVLKIERPTRGNNPSEMAKSFMKSRGMTYTPGKGEDIQVYWMRQVRSKEGKLRVERLDPPTFTPTEVRVFDGEVLWTFNGPKAEGTIRAESHYIAMTGERYSVLYRDMFDGYDLLKVLRSRSNVSIQNRTENGTNAVIIESGPEPGDLYPSFGLRIVLDPQRGLMPRVISTWVKSVEEPRFRMVVDEFARLGGGIWVPVKATWYAYRDAEISDKVTLTVDRPKSRWNLDMPDSAFALSFPPGTRVSDGIRGIKFVTGVKDTKANIDALSKSAIKEVLPITYKKYDGGGDTIDTSWWRRILIGIATTVVLVAIIALVARRRLSVKRSDSR